MSKNKKIKKDRAEKRYHFINTESQEDIIDLPEKKETVTKEETDYVKKDLRAFGIISCLLLAALTLLYYFNPPKVLEFIEKLLK